MKIFIETLGCPKNENDSSLFGGQLELAGHQIINDPALADAVIVNTCGFINDAKKESIDAIFRMRTIKRPDAILVVSGCLTQRYGDDLYREIPEADIILGVNDYEKLPNLLEAFVAGKRQKFLVGSPTPEDWQHRRFDGPPYQATLKISEGCDNRCTYCVIPEIRGNFRSRPIEDLFQEAQWLAKSGCKELILIAQDVTAYGLDLYGKLALPELLTKICAIEELKWIRLMYCYEDRITDELIKVMSSEPKICHYIDIPLQHYSSDVLKKMNRRSTPQSISETIQKLRQAMPDIHIRTTFITGFPGETQDDFRILLDFIQSSRFERLGVFAYSKEEGTPACSMKNQIPKRIKDRRRDEIMLRQMEISRELNCQKIGQIFETIIDEVEDNPDCPVAKKGYTYIGRTRYDAPEIDHSVIVQSNHIHKPGDIILVEITDSFDYDIVGMEVQNEFAK